MKKQIVDVLYLLAALSFLFGMYRVFIYKKPINQNMSARINVERDPETCCNPKRK